MKTNLAKIILLIIVIVIVAIIATLVFNKYFTTKPILVNTEQTISKNIIVGHWSLTDIGITNDDGTPYTDGSVITIEPVKDTKESFLLNWGDGSGVYLKRNEAGEFLTTNGVGKLTYDKDSKELIFIDLATGQKMKFKKLE